MHFIKIIKADFFWRWLEECSSSISPHLHPCLLYVLATVLFLSRPDSHIQWETIHWIVKTFASKQHSNWEPQWFQKKQSREQNKSHWIWLSFWKNSPLISAMFKPRPTLFFTWLINLKMQMKTEIESWSSTSMTGKCKATVYQMNIHIDWTYTLPSKHMEGPTTFAAPLMILNEKACSGQLLLLLHLFCINGISGKKIQKGLIYIYISCKLYYLRDLHFSVNWDPCTTSLTQTLYR